MAARKSKKFNPENITLDDIMKLGPRKIVILLVVLAGLYFLTDSNNNNTSDIISGTVTRVVDGDTAVIKIGGQDKRVRFLGVDTPETVHPNKPVQFYGTEASNFTKNSLTGRRVWLEYDASPTDRYNRHLAYIWLTKPGSINEETIRRDMFNAKLLLDGYAKVMTIRPNTRYEKLFTEFQDEARRNKKGIWSQL